MCVLYLCRLLHNSSLRYLQKSAVVTGLHQSAVPLSPQRTKKWFEGHFCTEKIPEFNVSTLVLGKKEMVCNARKWVGREGSFFFSDLTTLRGKLALLLCLINVSAMIYFRKIATTSPFCQIHSLWSRSNFSRYTRRAFFDLVFDIFANMSDIQYMQIELL